ncbi:hypothetical protein F5X99DRAFT_273286 [Biscogniauxia marginata]|nr:hypothetical protein F5X99DRAFT_273286 [Biscogniauxia marginata]
MCTYYYLHYHHVSPCTRDVDYAVHYSFCANATTMTEASGTSPLSGHPTTAAIANDSGAIGVGNEQSVVQQPCAALTYAPEYNPVEGIDYNNPCATGGCLVSQQCSSGGCRLQDLGGRWTCCRCHRGGNTFRWCVHPMKKVPDALCYHVICQDCQADV